MPGPTWAWPIESGTVKPIPIVFHIGPLQIHTYGIGLAITFAFALYYGRRRFRDNGLPYEWLDGAFLWIVLASIVGARIVHIVANISFYIHDPLQIPAIWEGGLSSFGGLAGGIPTGVYLMRKRGGDVPLFRALDVVSPVLMASWALGRLLGPQLMYAGGGHPTNAWYGMEYAGQIGKRIPVPIFQSIECFAILIALFWLEKVAKRRGIDNGFILAGLCALWGLARFNDEYLWLAVPQLWDAVEVTGLVLSAGGWIAMARLWLRAAKRPLASTDAEIEDQVGVAVDSTRPSGATAE